MTQHRARQRFGQNFLTDAGVIEQIVRAIDPQPEDNMVEIGPGLSALTGPLLAHLKHLSAVEIDRDLAARLRLTFPGERLTVTEADALEVDFAQFGNDLRLVGNLPYNISTPLLFACMQVADYVRDQHFMLQKEVVERMVAGVDDSDYGRLSVMLQYRYRMEKLFDVPPTAFEPAPKVVSAVVRMIPLADDRVRAHDTVLFGALVQRAFAQRRKMLRRALGDWAALMPWDEVGVEPTARAEQVDVAGFIRMSDALSARGLPLAKGA
ncbi:16S rRNA (adenine(1518)-N(6)/adenine(1519)-N(6))-dimethyltransferase RsmA [Orrella daihaiensis]|uniref:Ribosomal RNA small subunit methyltransferase A n=1 Tax=Orrella daihaiensis TaxID=2782176 RepID=A0ABY4ALI6_9BURK|nr:16S rRNA (adenine(1518)-N(6)/adenine(1519)-N(6))-dimethyltransferase RsmA [Orrella daihaiensis]UOD49960.1 16S rRNA (adenine(1518)-N(6)/adenine(1519)-N(6))-dimethyltransferase RsmA [Orrella daihaiensis]